MRREAICETIVRSKRNMLRVSRKMQNEAKHAPSPDWIGTCRSYGCRVAGSEMFQNVPTRFCKTKPNSDRATHPTAIGGFLRICCHRRKMLWSRFSGTIGG